MNEILSLLKTRGEQLDADIARAVGRSVSVVRKELELLAAKGEIMSCQSIKFEKGKKIEGVRCRLSGFTPPAAPGRKPKSQSKATLVEV